MMLYEIGFVIGETALKEPQVQKLIHSNEKFDGVMFESYFVQEYLSAFIHKFGAVGIEIMPLGKWTSCTVSMKTYGDSRLSLV